MLLDHAEKIYAHVGIGIGDVNSMRVHILECLIAWITVQNASQSSGNGIDKLLNSSFANFLLEIIDAGIREAQNGPAMDMLVSAVVETKEWLPVHCLAACERSTDKELQAIAEVLPGQRSKAVGSMKVTPLHLAAAKHNPNVKIIRQLIIFSIRVGRLKDANGDLALHYAARLSNSVNLMQELLQAYPDGATARNNKGETFLHLLCRNTSPEAPAILRVVLAAVPDVVRIQDKDGYLPLHVVVRGDLPDAIRIAMAKQLIAVYPEGTVVRNENGACPIHILVERKDRSVAPILDMMLESHPAAANTTDIIGHVPLHFIQDINVARRLVEIYPEALSINVPIFGTPLHQASGRDNVEVFRYLYNCRPRSLQEPDGGRAGWRPIHWCSLARPSLAMLRAVYELDPSAISAVDNFGQTPLFFFVNNNFKSEKAPSADAMDRLYFLLDKYPAAASISSNNGDTPYTSCHVNHTHARRLLLRAAPALDPEALHELNYSARRTALFLFYLSSQENGKLSIFTKLSLSPKGHCLVRRIVEFL